MGVRRAHDQPRTPPVVYRLFLVMAIVAFVPLAVVAVVTVRAWLGWMDEPFNASWAAVVVVALVVFADVATIVVLARASLRRP